MIIHFDLIKITFLGYCNSYFSFNLHYQYLSVDVDGNIYFAILSVGCVVLATFLDRWLNSILFNLITWVFFGIYFYRRGADEKWAPFK